MPGDRFLFTSRFILGIAGLAASAIADCSSNGTLTLTDVTEVASLASCATYFGDITLTNMTKTINLTGMETIVGEIYYYNEDELDVTIDSSSLKNLTGRLELDARLGSGDQPRADTYLSLPALKSISSILAYGWRSVSLNTSPNLTIWGEFGLWGTDDQPMQIINPSINMTTAHRFGVLDTVFSIEGLPTPTPVEYSLSSSVEEVTGYLEIMSNKDMQTLLLNDLEFVRYGATISSNAVLVHISVSAVDVGRLTIEENGRSASLSLPQLEKLGGRINHDDYITDEFTLERKYDGNAGGQFRHLLDVSVPLLREVHENEEAWKYQSDLSFTSNLFSELSLPRLETVNCTFYIEGNYELEDLWIPRLSYTKELEVHNNPKLLNFTANLLKKAGMINMTGSFTNVEFFSLELVEGDFYLAGDETMDCSWLNEHLTSGIVKGTYKCEGNYTKPAVERKPSTPTDEAQLEEWESGNGRWREDDKDAGGRLSTRAKAGIGGGVAAAFLATLAAGAWLLIHRRKKSQSTATTPDNNVELHGESGVAIPPDRRKHELDNDISRVEAPSERTRSDLPAELHPETVELSPEPVEPTR
ncbi:hypothetical protein BKA56DRAFT_678857 [Ilyonectria sp. MPI-CAGE-AT-0026]|nr:hypothetical protein BKA56DRAFT_678857 [Ilyonectria sp. MPI-CAGE-AT-0026]